MVTLLKAVRFLLNYFPIEYITIRFHTFLFGKRGLPVSPYTVKVGSVKVTLWLDWMDRTHALYILKPVWETANTEYIKKNLGEGSVFIDIGANAGYFSVLAKELGAIVYPIEPIPKNVFCLKKAGLKVYPIALSDVIGEEKIEYQTNDLGSPSTVGSFDVNEKTKEFMTSFTVPTETLDAFCEAKAITFVDLIKIDVQGAELKVLKGATKLLKNKAIQTVLFEFNKNDYGNEVVEYMQQYGYKVCDVATGQPVKTLLNKKDYLFV